ncbi:MAG: hypothetical protein DRP64_10415 [Verrucomicrobia bacterium]|nr:MAG: hypothetical protein DRP64_10415 [Verrucomicrobiota bacterium]
MKMKTWMNLVMVACGLAGGLFVSGCAPVTVSSMPPDANVYYKKGDKLIGPAPARVMLYANSREVVVRKAGYFSQSVVLSPVGSETVSVELRRRKKVFLVSHPSGAELYVKGQEKKVGKTPFLLDYNQSHRVFAVRALGYSTQIITIPEDPEGNITVDLEREPTVTVVSKPKNVEIYTKAGRRLGVTPLAVPASKEGMLELRKEGYYSQEVSVGPETESPYVVELDREPVIIVYSEPKNATVVHRGVILGRTPYRRLVKEDMDLEISADRYYTKKITIAADSPWKISVKLDPKPYIMVKSNPPNAELYRSGGVELLGTTPTEILVEKDVAFEMHKEGFDIKSFMLSVDSKREVTVPLVQSFASRGKTVLIDSDPSGAAVYRPGGAELLGRTPLEQRVNSERTFELQLDGFKPKIVTVAPDSANNIVFALAKDESARNVATSDPLLNTPSSF